MSRMTTKSGRTRRDDKQRRQRGRNRGRAAGGGGDSRRHGGDGFQPKRVECFDESRFGGQPSPEGAFRQLLAPLRNALKVQGYRTPTPVQEDSIPAILAGRDLLGSAQTGTGKTAAFVLPVLDLLKAGPLDARRAGREPRPTQPAPGRPRALILAPTRELADQIGRSIADYSRFLTVSHAVVFGGVSQRHQVAALRHGVDILVATPGRLLDLMGQGHVELSGVEFFILDEVDRMLDMGFLPDIKRVLEDVPARRQTLFFSATLAGRVRELAATLVRDPVVVEIEPDTRTVERINQQVYFVDASDKPELLESLLSVEPSGKVILFTQMKHAASKLAEKLTRRGVSAVAIHGNKTQSARTRALSDFKAGHFQVLVATDVAARGLDVDDITHVINYDLPMEAEVYVHRIGRTARAGADGTAISLCSAEDRALLHQVERHLRAAVPVVDDHAFHCERARNSRLPAPRPGGGRASARAPRGKGGGRRLGRRRN